MMLSYKTPKGAFMHVSGASPSLSSTSDRLQINAPRLGSDPDWLGFDFVAQLKGVWGFYKGSEPILKKPNRDDYLKSKAKRTSADEEIAASGSNANAGTGTVKESFKESVDISARIAEYRMEYRYFEEKYRLAKALIVYWVDPCIHQSNQLLWQGPYLRTTPSRCRYIYVSHQ